MFEAKGRAWGSERIWAELRRPHDGAEPVFVSEKVVRRVMREGGMEVVASGRRGYGSYRGEVSAHPGNSVNRDFRAEAPNVLRLTDATEFRLPGFKCEPQRVPEEQVDRRPGAPENVQTPGLQQNRVVWGALGRTTRDIAGWGGVPWRPTGTISV